jgi:predicted extracellular nuclease
MAKTTTTELNWISVDTDSLPATVKSKYAALQKAQEAARKAKEDFEGSFVQAARKAEHIGNTDSFAFGYRFGRLAIAKVDTTTENKKASTAKPKFSF